MELKRKKPKDMEVIGITFNRTTMELKHVRRIVDFVR